MAIHRNQGPEPTPQVTITVPASTNPNPTGPPPGSAGLPVLPKGRDGVVPREEVPGDAEYPPMRVSRLRAIWGLIVMSLLPGIVAVLAPTFWHGLPAQAHWAAYAFSGVLILAVVGLIVAPDGARK